MHQNPYSEAKNNIDSEDTGNIVEESTSWMANILKEGFNPCCYYYMKISVLFFRILCTEKKV